MSVAHEAPLITCLASQVHQLSVNKHTLIRASFNLFSAKRLSRTTPSERLGVFQPNVLKVACVHETDLRSKLKKIRILLGLPLHPKKHNTLRLFWSAKES